MGRTVIIKAKENATTRHSFANPASFLIAFLVVFAIGFLSLQAIIVVAGHKPPVRHTVTLTYEHAIMPPNITSNTDCPFTFTRDITVNDSSYLTFTPDPNHQNEVFSGWFTCANHFTKFDPSTPITDTISLFGFFTLIP